MAHRLVTGSFPALEAWLCADVAEQGDRVTVITGARLARLRLEERLRLSGVSRSRVQHTTFETFVQTWSGEAAGEPLPRGAGDAVLRSAAATIEDGYFSREVLQAAGLRAALLHALNDLALGGFESPSLALAAAELSAQGDPEATKLAGLARLFAAYRERLGAFSDEAMRLRLAREAIDSGDGKLDPVYLYAVLDLTSLQRRLLAACADRAPLTVLLPYDGAACRALEPLRRFCLDEIGCTELALNAGVDEGSNLTRVRAAWIAPGDEAAPRSEPDPSFAIVAAQSLTAEVREAAREVVRAIEAGVPSADVAVLFRDAGTYAALVHETLRAAGVPQYPAGQLPLARTPHGRAALALLRLCTPERRRGDLIDLFLTAPLRWQTLLGNADPGDTEALPLPQPTAWDRLSRRAHVTRGTVQWRDRLQALRAELELLPEDDDPALAQQRQSELTQLALLALAVERLFALLDTLLEPRTWQDYVNRFRALFTDLLSPHERLDDVVAAIEVLGPLGRFEPETAPAAFQEAAAAAIASRTYPHRRFDAGVFIGDLTSARGLTFHTVCLLGVGERSFPAPPARDPVLSDADRRALNAFGAGRLAVPGDEPGQEELLFQLTLQAARTRLVLSYPYADADGRERLPSYFVLRAAQVLSGAPVEPARLATVPAFRRLSGAQLATSSPETALTPFEYDLATVYRELGSLHVDGAAAGPVRSSGLGYLDRLSPGFARSREAVLGRAARSFTRFDGVFLDEVARARAEALGFGVLPLAPTAVEAYATCPRRYFMRQVLRVAAVEEPEETRRIRADHRGTLVHTVLERFYRHLQRAERLPLQRTLESEYRGQLHAIADEEFDKAEAARITGTGLLWEIERTAILDDLDEWLNEELDAAEREPELVPAAFEVRFGFGDGIPPARLDLGDGRSLAFKGVIDRVDRSPDGSRFRVVDYKTGARTIGTTANQLHHGRAVQLPVYLAAASGVAGLQPYAAGEAEYYFVTHRAEYKRVRFTVEGLREKAEELRTVLRTAADGIGSGRFFPQPGAGAANCRSCDFQPVCDARVAEQFQRKRGDPCAAGLIALEAIA